MVRTITTWIGDQQFESSHEGNKIRVDGNKKEGHGPKALLLSALAACSGIDVVEILQKMRIEFSDFSIEVETEQTTEHPKVFKDILAIFRMKTNPANREKISKAIELSLEKYCGVSAMLRKNSRINYKLEVLD
jgi:putative redox protein